MLRRNMNMSPLDRKLQAGPETFKTVNMRIISRIFTRSMINRPVSVSSFGKTEVGTKLVGVDGASLLDVLFDDGLQGALASDVGLVGFYIAVKRVFIVHLGHILANFVSHTPRRLVSNSYLSLKFLSGDAITGSRKQIHCVEPFMKRRVGTLHRRSYAGIKVVLAMLANVRRMTLKSVEIAKRPALRTVKSPSAITSNKYMFKTCCVIREKLLKLIKSHFDLPMVIIYLRRFKVSRG